MNFNTLKTNEYVKFVLNTDGFIDPYSMYLDVTVQLDITQAPFSTYGGIVLDGMSTSMISEMIVT